MITNKLHYVTQIECCNRDLSLKYHPDRGGSVERMTEINAAYADAKLIKGIS